LKEAVCFIDPMPTEFPIIDVNITLGRWPTRRVPCDQRDELIKKLKSHNVVEAWAGSYDGLFFDDLTAVNNRLAEACKSREPLAPPRLVAFGEINPIAPNWEAELQRCAEVHRMPGIRLHPNYHGYALDHPNFARLLRAATDRKLTVQLAVLMEDARMMHPLMRVPPVDLAPLAAAVAQAAGLKLILLNALSAATRSDRLYRLLDAGEVYVEIAMLEGVAGIEHALKDIPLERILFGSHVPSFYFEAATLKLQESPLPAGHINAISHENARRIIQFAR
jgi:predicted TIM-barrel fold metal-dependent hydrolase